LGLTPWESFLFFPLPFNLYSDEMFDDLFVLIDFKKTLK